MTERADFLVNNRSPRYLHGFQKDTNETTELPHTVPVDNQVTYIDSFTNYGVDTVYGKEFVIAASSGRADASGITNTPTGNIAATTVQAAINELDSEKAQLAVTLTSQRVPFANASGFLTDNSNFFYDSSIGLRVSNTTAATSTTSGSLVLGGGLGLGGAIYGGASDYSSVHILFGAVQFWRGTSRWQMRIAGGGNALGQLGAVAGLTEMQVGMGATNNASGSYWITKSDGTSDLRVGTTNILACTYSATGVLSLFNTTASTATTNGALVVSGGIGCGDYFTGKYRSSDGTAGLTATRTFYAASSSGGTVNVLNTVTIKDGIITAWTQA